MTLVRPSLVIAELSDAFRALWGDLAEELGVGVTTLPIDGTAQTDALGIIVAAGGEEDRALDYLTELQRFETTPVYLVGARESHRFAVEALRRGATDYFALPADLDLLRRTLGARAERLRERGRPSGPVVAADPFVELRGESAALHAVLEEARRVAAHGDVTVLLHGETGTGKELLARALHTGGPRGAGPFVPVNCAAIPGELMESELFGHERGAFTDAHTAKPGLFEEAHHGTLFLDEIGHLSLHLQGKLLRALEDRRIRRVGGTRSRELDVRIIAATNVNLAAAVRSGAFREDLYYRLNVVSFTLPPLRERADDAEQLAEVFLAKLSARYDLPTPELGPQAREALRRHSWPGNIRELRHAIERALLLSAPNTLDPAHLVPPTAPRALTAESALPFPATLEEIQAAAARAAVAQHLGNKSQAARQLGISRARLQRLLDRGEPST